MAGAMSEWPEPLGLAALRDPERIREFADIARQEYVAVGIRSSLHPQIDLTTEPRWGRQFHSFGNDAAFVADVAAAYIDGFQRRPELGPDSVATMAKHFPGGGPQRDGEDPHFPYGREQVYPGGRFDEHLVPFRRAIEAGTSALMPYYGMPIGLELDGEPVEEVGFGFNRQILTGLLRQRLGYDGRDLHRLEPGHRHRGGRPAAPGPGLGRGAPQPTGPRRQDSRRGGRPARRRSLPGAGAGGGADRAGHRAAPRRVGPAAAAGEVPARPVRRPVRRRGRRRPGRRARSRSAPPAAGRRPSPSCCCTTRGRAVDRCFRWPVARRCTSKA